MKPYWQQDGNEIYQMDARNIREAIPDESVHCCVTSPPYWGLRDYGLEPQIWDGEPDCEHDWGLENKKKNRWSLENGASNKQISNRGNAWEISQGYFCQKCGAWKGSLGLEPTPELYISHLVQIFREIRGVLRNDGTLWLNLGDSYASGKGSCFNPGGGENSLEGHAKLKENKAYKLNRPNISDLEKMGLKPKDLVGIPWRVALALQADGWWLRSDIIWNKPNPMPESVTDRPTKSHEYIFLLTKSAKYYYDHEAIKVPAADSTHNRAPVDFGGEKGRNYNPDESDPNYRGGNEQWGRTYHYNGGTVNKKSVWIIPTKPFSGAHFAVFPPALIEPCILAGCPKNGVVLDPFGGSGTTAEVAYKFGRKFIISELSQKYLDEIAIPRIEKETSQLRLFN